MDHGHKNINEMQDFEIQQIQIKLKYSFVKEKTNTDY